MLPMLTQFWHSWGCVDNCCVSILFFLFKPNLVDDASKLMLAQQFACNLWQVRIAKIAVRCKLSSHGTVVNTPLKEAYVL